MRFDKSWEVAHFILTYLGDFWGEAEAVNICDYSYYGDIYAATDVKINFISFQDFESIPLHEIETIKDYRNIFIKWRWKESHTVT